MRDLVIPMYFDTMKAALKHSYTTYVLAGGRGTTKSSFVGLVIPLLITKYPMVHAACFRKIGNTIQKSIYSQIVWGIYKLGIESFFTIPKTYNNPIVFNPTGQCIYFMGLDDADKVKSIKPAFGYIGITWFEELDQYNGEEELRKVTQSTARGGELFWDFRTFNPPISKNNWANMYAEDAEQMKDVLVVRNNYLMVPVNWLGQKFIEDAEALKARNPRAYEHEYMGIATGTGGDVFPNAEDMDMSVMVPIIDMYGNETKRVPLWQTFDKIYNGIDWGFAKDPFRFVRMYFNPAKLDLYIFDEYNTVKTRNAVVFNILYKETKKVSLDELVTADSAEEKSVADFKAYGAFIRGAEKGPESVRYGIKWLQGLNHIYIDKRRCPYTFKEFTSYEYERDKQGNFISAYPDKDNHSIDATRYAMEKYANRKGN